MLGQEPLAFLWQHAIDVSGFRRPNRQALNARACRIGRHGYLTLTGVAKALAIGRTTLHRWLAEGRMPPMPIVDGVRALHPTALPAWRGHCEAAKKLARSS